MHIGGLASMSQCVKFRDCNFSDFLREYGIIMFQKFGYCGIPRHLLVGVELTPKVFRLPHPNF